MEILSKQQRRQPKRLMPVMSVLHLRTALTSVVLSLPFYLHRAVKTRTKQSRRAWGMCSLKVNSVLWLQRRTQRSLRAPLSHDNIVEDFSSRGHELRSILARWRGDVVVIQAGKYCEALFAHALSNRYYRDYINTIIFILPLCQQA